MKIFSVVGLILTVVVSSSSRAEPKLIPGAYFRIVGPDGKTESYLLGTVHSPIDMSEFPGDMKKQIRSAKSVSVERVLAEDDLALYKKDPITALAKMAVFSGGVVDADTRTKLIGYGIPVAVAARIPDRACGVLGVVEEVAGKALPLDLAVMQEAYAGGRNLKALDSDQMRNSAQAQSEAAHGACSLKQLLTDHSGAELKQYFINQGKSEVADYRQGKIDDDENLNDPIVVSRNLAWMDSILGDVKRGNAFIAAGQDHLYGQNGLIQLLRRRGYSVEEVRPAKKIEAITPASGTAH